MKFNPKILLIPLAIFGIVGCSKLNTDFPPAPEISTHGEGVFNLDSPQYHGKKVADATNGLVDCQQCHASDYSGGITGVGCNTPDCHPTVNVHIEGILDPATDNFHGKFIRRNGWDMLDCQTCHNDDYSGGIVSPSCLTCHTLPDGPEACNTCHGDFDNIERIAPPKDIDDNTEIVSVGVGAHEKHLYTNERGRDIPCITCHNVPNDVYDPGHLDSDLPAEIIFGEIATKNLGINSSYDFSTATCSEIYCHGNWEFLRDSSSNQFAYTADKMTGNNVPVIWNQVDGTQVQCGSCHNLPPTGHIPADLSACGGCHSGIVDPNGEIVDSLRYKHMNGEPNVFGN